LILVIEILIKNGMSIRGIRINWSYTSLSSARRIPTLHWPCTRLLSHLSLLLLLGPARSGNLVSGHEGTRLCNRHQVVGRDHAWVGVTDEAAWHTLGSDSVLSGQVLFTFLGWNC
jgi:hypothetical protein